MKGSMEQKKEHMKINREEIFRLLEEGKKVTREQISDILDRARRKEKITHLDISRLLYIEDKDLIQEMFEVAGKIKRDVYGNRVVLFAPLYVSDFCVNNCVYCGYKKENHFHRRKLTMDEVRKEVMILEEMGHKRLALEAGEDPVNCDIEYILDCIDTIYDTYNKNGKIRRINVNIAATTVENYRRLQEKGIGTYILFQETFDEEVYRKVHPNCIKGNYDYHTTAFDRAMEAGIEDVGAGVLFGLADPRFEVLALMMQNEHLEKRFGVGFHTISVPRLRPAEGVNLKTFPHLLDDEMFKKIVTIIRIAVPYTGMILSTRESAEMREILLKYGISQVSAGSCTGVGGYEEHIQGKQVNQFQLADERSPRQVIEDLMEAGYIPSYCTSCYRTGRVGEKFMEIAKTEKIHNMCKPNALTTLLEYAVDYGDQELLQRVEGFVREQAAEIENIHIQNFVLKNIDKLKAGERDLYL